MTILRLHLQYTWPLAALLFLLAAVSPSAILSPAPHLHVAAQSSAATCAASIQALQTACCSTCDAATCCSVIRTQLYSLPDCYCSQNSTVLIQLADACSFALPQNLTSCFSTGTPPPSPSPPAPPSLPPPPPPTSTNSTCDLAWSALLSACNENSTLPRCCAQISASMSTTPECYCEFTRLNVTVFYNLVAPGACNLDVPPTVSTCLNSLSGATPPPPGNRSPPPPPPSARSPPPPNQSPPPPLLRTSSPPPPPPLVTSLSPPPPPPPSNSLVSATYSLLNMLTPTHLLVLLVTTLGVLFVIH